MVNTILAPDDQALANERDALPVVHHLPNEFSDSFALFQNGRFAGWGLDGRSRGAVTTADGIGVGTTRSQLDAAIGDPLQVRPTTLGTEFTAGSYHGLFDGPGDNAPITDMWAGVSCAAR